jgi:hypothetical protein
MATKPGDPFERADRSKNYSKWSAGISGIEKRGSPGKKQS